MVKIRFRRTGSKKNAHYRVVAAPSTAPRDGRFLEILGHYDPNQDPAEFVIKEDRLSHWLSVGAQPTDSLKRLLKTNGILEKDTQVEAGEGEESAEEAAEAEADIEAEVETDADTEADDEDEAETETETQE